MFVLKWFKIEKLGIKKKINDVQLEFNIDRLSISIVTIQQGLIYKNSCLQVSGFTPLP